ncbi:MAG: LacI family transcriptional regulator [Enterococcaceae bacterium]|jgi:LacI family transcriptional regulator|nr:LacI family transcriptional regulator [Enterococcaceae bacterium]
MKMTIKEIADLAGVSITTVSQILNNKGGRFSATTRKRVLDVVEKYHYKADFFASSMITRHSKTIGMIVPDVTDFFFSKIIEGVEAFLNASGYMIVLCNSQSNPEKEERYLEDLLHRSVDGIILATPNLQSDKFDFQGNTVEGVPFLLIDRGHNRRKGGKLLVEEFQGVYTALDYLVEHGHRHIGFLREKEGYYTLCDRFAAYQEIVEHYQLPFKESYVAQGPLNIDGGYEAAREVLKNPEITAIFCGNDEMAIGCYHAIDEAHKKIPDDISVIGFDGLEISRYVVPTLSTITQPAFEIGYTAAKFLLRSIETAGGLVPNKVFATKFVRRNSIKSLTASKTGDTILFK